MSEIDKKKPPRHVEIGIEYGLIKPKYNFKDYIQEAVVLKNGFETIVVDGVQRAGKSNLSLQISGWAKEASIRIKRGDKWLFPGWDNKSPVDEMELWELVLHDLVFKTSDFVNTLEQVPEGLVLDSLLWDDINAHFTNTQFKINPQEYSAVDSTFTVVGTSCKVIVVNIPNLTRLAKNVKDNCTFEIFVGKNKLRKMMRIFRLPGTKRMEMNLFKVDVEPPSDFDIYKIPAWAWEKYEALRIKLAKEALQILKASTNMEDMGGFVPLGKAVEICQEYEVPWGVMTLQQLGSRQVIPKQMINQQFCVDEKTLRTLLESEKVARDTRKRKGMGR